MAASKPGSSNQHAVCGRKRVRTHVPSHAWIFGRMNTTVGSGGFEVAAEKIENEIKRILFGDFALFRFPKDKCGIGMRFAIIHVSFCANSMA
jgi:hypothetical protein